MDIVKVFNSADGIAAAARDYVLEAARQSIAKRDVFNLVLAGGSTPRKLYELLAKESGIEWSKWHFFLGDERFVPHEDERSNYKMAKGSLFSKISVGENQVHWVPVYGSTADKAAAIYEKQIRKHFGSDTIPAFDLILLGMGSDSHTASLFPGKPALEEKARLVVASPPGVLPPPVARVTFTLPLINAAHRVLFMVAGADKAGAFQAVREDLQKPPDQAVTPAGKVRPSNGELLWFVDHSAAGIDQA